MSSNIDIRSRTTVDGGPRYFKFFNEGEFIRVVNMRTKVSVYINKKPLLIQKDGSNSFMLKNDTFAGYYAHNVVAHPITNSIDELVDILVGYVHSEIASTADVSGSGSVNSSTDKISANLLSIKTNYKSSSYDVQSLVKIDDGSNVIPYQDESTIDLYTTYDTRDALTSMTLPGNAVDEKVVRQSRQYIPATFVTNVIAMIEGKIDTSDASASFIAKIGCFEDSGDLSKNLDNTGRGVYFQFNMTTSEWEIHVLYNDGVTQQSQVYTQKAAGDFNEPSNKNQWNIDTLDGTGQSGINMNANDLNIFVIQWQPVEDIIKCGILQGERVVYCHEIRMKTDTDADGLMYEANGYVSKFNVPVRWEIQSTGATSGTMYQGKAIIYDNSSVQFDRLLTYNTDLYSRNVAVRGDSAALFALRLKESANRAKIVPKRLVVMQTNANGIAKWELVQDGVYSGHKLNDSNEDIVISSNVGSNVDWVDKEGSFVQIAPPIDNVNKTGDADKLMNYELYVNDGHVLASDYIHGAGYFSYDIEKFKTYATSKIDGEMDRLTLRVTNVSGVIDVIGGVEWIELE